MTTIQPPEEALNFTNAIPKLFQRIKNRDNTTLRSAFHVVSNLFFAACFFLCCLSLVYSNDKKPDVTSNNSTNPLHATLKEKKYHTLTCVLLAVITLLIPFLVFVVSKYAINENSVFITPANGKVFDFVGSFVGALLGWWFTKVDVSEYLLSAISCFIFGVFFLQVVLSPMNTDLGVLQWITGLVVGFFYEDLIPKEKELLLFGGCFFIAMFRALYDRHLILEDEREKRTRLEDLDRKVGELKGNLKSADDEAKKKDNEITVLKDQIKVIQRDLSAGLKDATDVANTREKEIGVLEDQLEEARKELSLEDRKLHQLKTDLKAANDKVDTKNEEIIGLRNQLKVVQEELSVEVEKVDQLMADLKAAIEERGKAKLIIGDNEPGRVEALMNFFEGTAKKNT